MTDAAERRIVLPGFPKRDLNSASNHEADVSERIIHGMLSVSKIADWPQFSDLLDSIVKDCEDLTDSFSEIPNLLSALIGTENTRVAQSARRELISLVDLCSEVNGSKSAVLEAARGRGRAKFITEKDLTTSDLSGKDKEYAYWKLKALSCSTNSAVRAKADRLLARFFGERHTIGCESCSEK